MIAEGMVDLRTFPLMNQTDSSTFGSFAHLQQLFDFLRAELNPPRQPEPIRPMLPLDPNSKAAAMLKNMSSDDKRKLLDELRPKRSALDDPMERAAEAGRKAAAEVRRIMGGE